MEDTAGDGRAAPVVVIGTDGSVASELVDALRAIDLDVSGPTLTAGSNGGELALAVALVTPALLVEMDDGVLRTVLTPFGDRVVPVTAGVAPGTVLPELSQLSLDRLSVNVVVRRIAVLARAGGGMALSALDRLRLEAHHWDASGRPTQALLRGERVDDAVALLADRRRSPASDDDRVRDFVRQSGTAARRRQHRAAAAAAVVSLALLLGGTSALWQRSEAQAAEDAASQRAATAASQRLAQLALDLVDADPDLPTLLAAEAMSNADTRAAREAARRALTAVPPHRTHAVAGTTIGMATAARGSVVALVRDDGAVDLRSADDGSVVTSVNPLGKVEVESVLLSEEGDALVIDVAGRPPTVRRAPDWDAVELALPIPDARPRGMLPDGRMLAVGTGGSLAVDLSDGSASPHRPLDPEADIAIASTGAIATLRDGDLLITDATGHELRRTTIEGGTGLAFSGDGASVFVGHPWSAVTDVPVDPEREPLALYRTSGVRVAALHDGAAVGSLDGRLILVTPGAGSVRKEFPAHRGPIVGVGILGDGRFVTAGSDALRVWRMPVDMVRYPLAPEVQLDDAFYAREVDYVREAARDTLAVDADRGEATVALAAEHALVLDTTTLDVRRRSSLGPGVLRRTRAAGPPGQLLVVATGSRTAALVDATDDEEVWKVQTDVTIPNGLVALSPGGHSAAVVDLRGVLLLDGRSGTASQHPFSDRSIPIGLAVSDDGTAQTVQADGDLHSTTGTLRRATPTGTSALAAAWAADGSAVVAAGDNVLYRTGKGAPERLTGYPPEIEPFALRPTPDGRLVAVIGRTRTVVLDGSDGERLLDLPMRTSETSAVRDAVILDGAVLTVRGDGSIERWPLWGRKAVRDRVERARPRVLTDEERRITEISEDR